MAPWARRPQSIRIQCSLHVHDPGFPEAPTSRRPINIKVTLIKRRAGINQPFSPQLGLISCINRMRSFKTLTHSWKTPRAIHPPKSSQIALPSRTRRHSLHSCAITPGQGPAQAHRDQYHWIDGAESLEKYTRGGYHPVMIGDVLNKRYQIVDKLGHGGYSTVWLARDTQQELYVALKVGISDSRLHETAVLKRLSDLKPRTSSDLVTSSGHDAIPRLLDEFTVRGPNGTHPCYATTPAQCSLSDASRHSLFRLEVAKGSICEARVGGRIHAQPGLYSRRFVACRPRLLRHPLQLLLTPHPC